MGTSGMGLSLGVGVRPMGTSNSVLTLGGGVRPARRSVGVLILGVGVRRPMGRSGGVLTLGGGERPTGIFGALMPHVSPSRPGVVSGASGGAAETVPRRVRVDGVKRSSPGIYASAYGKRR